MRFIITAILFVGIWTVCAAQITRLEYFIDDDPGIGRATPATISPGTDVSRSLNVPLAAQSTGFHILNLRVRDAEGKWSLTYPHVFFTTNLLPADEGVAAAEYYLDEDPGLGNGTPVGVTPTAPDATLSFTVDLAAIELGLHVLHLRVSDKSGVWSHTTPHVFFIQEGGGISDIVAIRYSFAKDSYASDTLIYREFAPAPSISAEFVADLSQLPEDGTYTMSVWAVTDEGVWSLVVTRQITVDTDATGTTGNSGVTQRIEIFPNPNHGYFTVEVPESSRAELFELFNATGQSVHRQILEGGPARKVDVTVSSITSGVYFAVVERHGKVHVQRMVVN